MGTKRGEPLSFVELAAQCSQDECLIWPFTRSRTDGRARLYLPKGKDAKGRVLFKECAVHRIVCERVYGAAPTPRHQVAHSCGNGHLGCVNAKHLRWATAKENEQDKAVHGTLGRGERNGFAKLNAAAVLEIRAAEGVVPRRRLAEKFKINPWYVRNIQKRRCWEWLE